MEISIFRNGLIEEVRMTASAEGLSSYETFLSMFTETLIDSEVLSDFVVLPFEGIGSHNRRIQIDGYSFDDLDDCLNIFICHFTDSDSPVSLTKSEAERLFGRVIAFVEESMSGFITKNAEESSPGYGLAIDIQNRYKNVSKYKFYILTDMTMSSRIIELNATEVCGRSAGYSIWDVSRLQSLMDSKSGKEDIIIDLTEFAPYGIPCLKASETNEYTAYLCNIPGRILADLYNTYGSRLLEGNVRSFLSARGKVNKGIRNTILNRPEMFFAYNNGIAATAYDATVTDVNGQSHLSAIKALQIVNGGQTTASLAMAILNDKERANGLQNIFVPMKLSVVSPEQAVNLIPNISRYANSQNKVSDADLSANHPFHIRMEGFSRRIWAPAINGNQYGTHWYYERAKGQYNQEQAKMSKAEKNKFIMQNPKQQMFTKTDLAKYYNIFRLVPDQVCLGAQKNYIKFAEWAFNEDKGQWTRDDTQFNEDYFKRVISLAILFKQTDKLVRVQPWYELGYKAQVVIYALSKFLFQIKKQYPDKCFDYKTIWNRQDVPDALQEQIITIAELIYIHLTSEEREVQNVTEWAKRKSCWEKAQAIQFTLDDGILAFLIDKDDEQTGHRDAKKEQSALNSVHAMVDVANYGVENWKNLLSWGKTTNILSPTDLSFIQRAVDMEKGSFPSEKQSNIIMKILDRAREESYPG